MSTRISRLSANEDIFRANEDYYNGALARAGFSEKIEYLVQEKGQEGGKLDKKNRKETKPKGIKLGKGEGIEKHKACLGKDTNKERGIEGAIGKDSGRVSQEGGGQ